MNHVPDQRDRELLSYLQDNARMTSSEIGSLVGLSPSGIQKRMRKLEEKGVIKKYATIVDRSCFGYDMLVFIQVTLQGHTPELVEMFDVKMQEIPEVLESHRLIGLADYLLKVVVKNNEHLDHFIMKQLLPIAAVERVTSNLVLKTIKETTNIALEDHEL
jgi:DNA-binding Lrp family transcriptional regulator